MGKTSKMEQTIHAIDILIATYIGFLQFDIMVFSQWWLYAPFCIPFIFYVMFFALKWQILTLPIWLPIKLIFRTRKVEDE